LPIRKIALTDTTNVDVTERLRAIRRHGWPTSHRTDVSEAFRTIDEAADEIERLRAETARLVAALDELTTDITSTPSALDSISLAKFEHALEVLAEANGEDGV
jgi:hypothetical protein